MKILLSLLALHVKIRLVIRGEKTSHLKRKPRLIVKWFENLI
jgi:hypothetical protein